MNNILVFKLDSGQQTATQIRSKIAQLDAIISALYDTALKPVQGGDIYYHEIDTGQSRQRVQYTTMDSVVKSIEGYEKLRTMLQVKLQPRMVRLMDSKNFR